MAQHSESVFLNMHNNNVNCGAALIVFVVPSIILLPFLFPPTKMSDLTVTQPFLLCSAPVQMLYHCRVDWADLWKQSVSLWARFRQHLHNMKQSCNCPLLASADAVTLAVPWPALRSLSARTKNSHQTIDMLIGHSSPLQFHGDLDHSVRDISVSPLWYHVTALIIKPLQGGIWCCEWSLMIIMRTTSNS